MMNFILSKTGIYIICSVVIAGMFIAVVYYKQQAEIDKSKLATCNVLITTQNAGVLAMKKAADEAAIKQERLEKEIAVDKAKSYQQIKAIETLNISNNCEEAIKEGIAAYYK